MELKKRKKERGDTNLHILVTTSVEMIRSFLDTIQVSKIRISNFFILVGYG